MGLLSEHHHYIVMTLDAATIDLEPFQYSNTNFTLIRMVNQLSPLMKDFVHYMKEVDPKSNEDDAEEDGNSQEGGDAAKEKSEDDSEGK